ncbi:MAG TPA: hypothetical protein ENI87_03865 [bacterium]|nr:hypothetical protein [bacterium]
MCCPGLGSGRVLVAAALLCAVFQSGCRPGQPWEDPDFCPPEPPQRIVLASVLAAESLLELLPRERIAGVHTFAADPDFSLVADAARGLPLLGASPEQLLSVRPDLVVVDAYTRAETLALLATAGVPVVRTRDPKGFDDIAANLRRLGRVVHLMPASDRLVTRMRERLEEVRAAGEACAPWRLMSLDGALHTHGEGSLFDAVVRAAGARNIAAEHGVGAFRKLDVEEVLAWRPDALVLAGQPGQHLPGWLAQYPGFELLPCVQHERILFVPGSLLSTTSHHLVDTAAFVQRQLQRWGTP